MKQGKAPFVPLLSLETVLSTLKGINSARDQAILMLSHYMGLRAMELAALTIGDVYDERTAQLRETVRLLACMTKGKKFREVFLTNERAKGCLLKYLQERNLKRTDAPLFMSQKGGAFSANTMQRAIGAMYRKAGVNGSSHSGRRSYATHLIESGADIYSIKELLGHSSIATTQEYFSKNPQRLRNLVSALH